MKKMKESVNVKIIYHFYHHVVKAELKKRDFPKDVVRKIDEEHHKIIQRAKDIGNSRLLSSYIMGSYFIAMNRSTGKSAEENYEMFRDGLYASKLFHKVMGEANSYLDPKKWQEDYNGQKKVINTFMKMIGSLIFYQVMMNMI